MGPLDSAPHVNNAVISLIVPVYKVSDYIERCLRSVISQRYNQIECILVDDCSPDDSIEKCRQMIRAYEGPIHFCILHHDKNRGVSAARNTGMTAATGDFLFFLDGDDELAPDCFEKMISITQEHPDVELVLGNFEIHNDDGIPWQVPNLSIPVGIHLRTNLNKTLSKGIIFPEMAWNILVRRDFIARCQLSFKEGIIHEDILWTYFLYEAMARMYYCDDITYHYYLHSNSIVSGSSKKVRAKSFVIIYDEILHHLTPGQEQRILDRYVGEFCRYYITYKAFALRFNSVVQAYIQLCRAHGCRVSYQKLVAARFLSCFPKGLSLYEMLGRVRSKLMGLRVSCA